jgi:Holliday junction DNA helicase RuvB
MQIDFNEIPSSAMAGVAQRMRDNDLDPEPRPEDRILDLSLRPRRLAEFIGQENLKANLAVFLKAAQQREEPLDHLLLYGPPGLGKTTLAHIVANEMDTTIHVTSGPAIERPGDLVGILTNLDPNAVLFIDEIHRLSRAVEEILYPAMEDCKVDIMIGKGPAARSIRLEVPRFTVVGATTRQGLLTGPLRDRFGIISHFQFYDRQALYEIITRSARILGYDIDATGAEEIALRSRGTPRIANRLLRRVRDFAQVDGLAVIGKEIVDKACRALEVDDLGLDRIDRTLLTAMIERYRGGPVGLETLAATTGEDATTIEDVYEPYLLQIGMLQRTPRGRTATEMAYKHLGLKPPRRQEEGSLDFDSES